MITVNDTFVSPIYLNTLTQLGTWHIENQTLMIDNLTQVCAMSLHECRGGLSTPEGLPRRPKVQNTTERFQCAHQCVG